MTAIPPRRELSSSQSGEHRVVDPKTQSRGDFVRKVMLEKQDDTRVLELERLWAARLDAWLRKTRTSRDSFGRTFDVTGAYVDKIVRREVRCPASALFCLDEHNALDLIDELRDFVREQARMRRAG